MRRKKLADGTYGAEEEYHSDSSIKMNKAAKKLREQKKVRGRPNSEYRYIPSLTKEAGKLFG